MTLIIQWEIVGVPLTSEDIQAAEADLDIKIPQELIDFMGSHDGGSPNIGPIDFEYDHGRHAEITTFGELYRIGRGEGGSEFVNVNRLVSERYCRDLLVFGSDPGGWFFGFDTSGPERPVCLFIRETEEKVRLANNLQDFLRKAGPPVNWSDKS